MTIQELINRIVDDAEGFKIKPKHANGATRKGISLNDLNSYTGKSNKLEDLAYLDNKTAQAIYWDVYYIKSGISQLPEAIQPVIFDMAVEQSCKDAIKLLQYQLLDSGYFFKYPDGIINTLTLVGAETAFKNLKNDLINALVDRRISRYYGMVNFDRDNDEHLDAWIARAKAFRP